METAAMDKLKPDRKVQLKRCSDGRLRGYLLTADYAEGEVVKMERKQLMETVAQLWVQEQEETTTASAVGGQTEFREYLEMQRQMMTWEKERREKETQERERREKEDRERNEKEEKLEKERKEKEENERRKRWEVEENERKEQIARWQSEQKAREEARKEEKERFEREMQEREKDRRLKEQKEGEVRRAEKERFEREMEEREKDRRLKEAKQQKFEERKSGLAERLKTAGECLKNVLPQMPPDSADVPLFLRTVENLYDNFKIEADLQAKLLMPLLTERARTIVGRMPKEQLDNFEAVKKILMSEYKITPRQLKSKFLSAHRMLDETFQLFTSRLTTLFNYYAESRGVVDDYKALCNLLIADRLKDTMPSDALKYVLSQEGEGWFEPTKIATLADVYVNNCRETNVVLRPPFERGTKPAEFSTKPVERGGPQANRGRGSFSNGNRNPEPKKCHICGSESHLAYSCEKRKQTRTEDVVMDIFSTQHALFYLALLIQLLTVADPGLLLNEQSPQGYKLPMRVKMPVGL